MVRIHPIPPYRYQCSQPGNLIGLLPLVELGKLIGAQEEKKVRIGMDSSELPKRIHGVGRAVPIQLHLTHVEGGILGYGSSSHFHSDERW